MSLITNLSQLLNLSVASIEVNELNPIIFKTKVVSQLSGLTKDGDKFYHLDLKSNSATEVTSATIKEQAISAATISSPISSPTSLQKQSLMTAENLGMIQSVTFSGSIDVSTSNVNILAIAKTLGMKVTAVEIKEQNEVIFKTHTIDRINGLTKDDGKYYQLDLKKNTATIINAVQVAEQAKADLLAGKHTDYVAVAESFNLITSLTLSKSSDIAVVI